MLTHPQFYLRVLEVFLSRYRLKDYPDTFEEHDDLVEYLQQNFPIKPEHQDDGQSMEEALAEVETILHGFVQGLGKRVDIDLKFMTED